MIDFYTLSPPTDKSPHLMADFVELLCLVNLDNEVRKNDAITRVYHDPFAEASREVELEEGIITYEDRSVPQFKDNQLKAGEDWYSYLEFRQHAFKDYYPFDVREDCLFLKETLLKKHEIYILLLLCSSLRLFKKTFRNNMTTDFEFLSAKAIEAYLPSFKVHNFGKSLYGRSGYSTKLLDAIEELSKNLNERNITEPGTIGDKDTGDGGLDVVAWKRPLAGDEAPGSLICFAQCACSSTEWKSKQSESNYSNWKHRIDFMHPPANFMFIPYCFRDAIGGWYKKDYVQDSILMDRLRICFLLDDEDITGLESYKAVDSIIAFTEQAVS